MAVYQMYFAVAAEHRCTDTGAPSGDYVTTRSDGTISISAMNSYMDDQIPLIIAIGRYSGEVRKSGLTNVVYAVD